MVFELTDLIVTVRPSIPLMEVGWTVFHCIETVMLQFALSSGFRFLMTNSIAMRSSCLLYSFLLWAGFATAQNRSVDSLKRLLSQKQADTTRVNTLLQLSRPTDALSLEENFTYAREAKQLAEKIGYLKGRATATKAIGVLYYFQNQQLLALENWLEALPLYEQSNDNAGKANVLNNISAVYQNNGDVTGALQYINEALQLAQKEGDSTRIVSSLINLAGIQNSMGNYDAAITYLRKALAMSKNEENKNAVNVMRGNLAELYRSKGDDENALRELDAALGVPGLDVEYVFFDLNVKAQVYQHQKDYKRALLTFAEAYDKGKALASGENASYIGGPLVGMAKAYQQLGDNRRALSVLKKAESLSVQATDWKNKNELFQTLVDVSASLKDFAGAYRAQTTLMAVRDSLAQQENARKLDSSEFKAMLKARGQLEEYNKAKSRQEEALSMLQYDNRLKTNYYLSGSAVLLLAAGTLFWSNRKKQRTNKLLNSQKEEISEQRNTLEQTLQDLKAAQQQLVQQEKMASLGELTAGIAHEIQNPLNFVNNFSAVNKELVDELQVEAQRGNVQEVMAIAADIKSNEEKINHHGKRADSIVKGMLQHARASTGKKELTDINKLADEYLRLSYQGMRSKDKTFNAVIDTSFDGSIVDVNIVAQDVGRVLLNLFNNAFYAVNQKKQLLNGTYEPTVSVSTKKESINVVITVKDNGTGMSEHVASKVFQPFFTTKPTGEGTGLGLSLSYDIITKGHGGTLSVQSEEGEGSAFVVTLPAV